MNPNLTEAVRQLLYDVHCVIKKNSTLSMSGHSIKPGYQDLSDSYERCSRLFSDSVRTEEVNVDAENDASKGQVEGQGKQEAVSSPCGEVQLVQQRDLVSGSERQQRPHERAHLREVQRDGQDAVNPRTSDAKTLDEIYERAGRDYDLAKEILEHLGLPDDVQVAASLCPMLAKHAQAEQRTNEAQVNNEKERIVGGREVEDEATRSGDSEVIGDKDREEQHDAHVLEDDDVCDGRLGSGGGPPGKAEGESKQDLVVEAGTGGRFGCCGAEPAYIRGRPVPHAHPQRTDKAMSHINDFKNGQRIFTKRLTGTVFGSVVGADGGWPMIRWEHGEDDSVVAPWMLERIPPEPYLGVGCQHRWTKDGRCLKCNAFTSSDDFRTSASKHAHSLGVYPPAQVSAYADGAVWGAAQCAETPIPEGEKR